jgi:hypothetical protein
LSDEPNRPLNQPPPLRSESREELSSLLLEDQVLVLPSGDELALPGGLNVRTIMKPKAATMPMAISPGSPSIMHDPLPTLQPVSQFSLPPAARGSRAKLTDGPCVSSPDGHRQFKRLRRSCRSTRTFTRTVKMPPHTGFLIDLHPHGELGTTFHAALNAADAKRK